MRRRGDRTRLSFERLTQYLQRLHKAGWMVEYGADDFGYWTRLYARDPELSR